METKKTTWPSRSGRGSRVERGCIEEAKNSDHQRFGQRLGTGTCQSPVEPAEPVIRPSTTVRTRRHAACRNIWNRGVSGEVVKENVQGVVTVAMIGHSIRPSWIGLERHHGRTRCRDSFWPILRDRSHWGLSLLGGEPSRGKKLGVWGFHGFAVSNAVENELSLFPSIKQALGGGGVLDDAELGNWAFLPCS